jgi:hypothetical protein
MTTNSRAASAGAQNAEATAGMVPAERENLIPADDDAPVTAPEQTASRVEAPDEPAVPAERVEPEKVASEQEAKRAALLVRYREKQAQDRAAAKGSVRKVGAVGPAGDSDPDGEDGAGEDDGAAADADAGETQDDIEEERRELAERAANARGKGGKSPEQSDARPQGRAEARGKGAKVAPQAEDAADEEASVPDHVVLVVNGKPVKKTFAEAIALAQQAEAAQSIVEGVNIVDLAKRHRDAAKAAPVSENQRGDADPEHQRGKGKGAKAGGAKPASKASADSDGSDPEHQPAEDDPELLQEMEELTDQIQMGDRSEGAKALVRAFERLQSRDQGQGTPTQTAPAEIERIAVTALSKQRVNSEIQTALTRFGEDYPDIVNDELLADAGIAAVRKEIEKDLKALGVTEEAIRPVTRDTATMMKAYVDLRLAGHKVRTPDQIFGAAGKTLTDRFGFKPSAAAPAATNGAGRSNGAGRNGAGAGNGSQADTDTGRSTRSDQAQQDAIRARTDRKRALTPQPRAAGVRSQMPQAPKPLTAREILERQRVRQGYQRTM